VNDREVRLTFDLEGQLQAQDKRRALRSTQEENELDDQGGFRYKSEKGTDTLNHDGIDSGPGEKESNIHNGVQPLTECKLVVAVNRDPAIDQNDSEKTGSHR
jgi:hypothetical protein